MGYGRQFVVEGIARAFHDRYEAEARRAGWSTQASTRVPFEQLPEANRKTMLRVVSDLLDEGVIEAPGYPAVPR